MRDRVCLRSCVGVCASMFVCVYKCACVRVRACVSVFVRFTHTH